MRGWLVATMAAVALLGCANDDATQVGTLPTAAVTTTVAATTTTAPATTVASSTSAAATTTTGASTTVAATVAPGVVGLSPDGPWHLVDSAPGITAPGLVYELMPKLWAFIQVEETDASTYSWTLNDADRPIIEAYLQAQLTYFQAATSDPIDLDLPGWTEFYAEGGSARYEFLTSKQAEGQTVDLDLGVVLSPQVIGDERTEAEAIVADCMLDGGVFRARDGSLAEGSSIGVGAHDWGARMRLSDGRWIVDQEGPVVGTCA